MTDPIVPDAGQNIWVQVASLLLFALFIGLFAFSAWSNYRLTKRMESGGI